MGEPRSVELRAMRVLGIETRTKNADEADTKKGKIGPLWARFFAEKHGERIPARKDASIIIGAYTRYESDEHGLYTLVVGAEVAPGTAAPAGFVAVDVPAQRYLVFTARGAMPAALIETWGQIWRYFAPASGRRRAFTTDLELHRGDGSVDVHVAVAPSR